MQPQAQPQAAAPAVAGARADGHRPAAPAAASEPAVDLTPVIGARAGDHLAAGHGVARRSGARTTSRCRSRAPASVDGHADAHVRSAACCACASVQEGSFMRSGGAMSTFTQQVEQRPYRHHDHPRRRRDRGVRYRPARRGPLRRRSRRALRRSTVSGTATGPGSTPMGLQFRPVTLTVQ